MPASLPLQFRLSVLRDYPDILTDPVTNALEALAPLNSDRLEMMSARIERRNHVCVGDV